MATRPDISLTARHGGEYGTNRLKFEEHEGTRQTILLNEEDVLKMGQSAQHLTNQILAKRSRAGAEAVVMTPVAQISQTSP